MAWIQGLCWFHIINSQWSQIDIKWTKLQIHHSRVRKVRKFDSLIKSVLWIKLHRTEFQNLETDHNFQTQTLINWIQNSIKLYRTKPLLVVNQLKLKLYLQKKEKKEKESAKTRINWIQFKKLKLWSKQWTKGTRTVSVRISDFIKIRNHFKQSH